MREHGVFDVNLALWEREILYPIRDADKEFVQARDVNPDLEGPLSIGCISFIINRESKGHNEVRNIVDKKLGSLSLGDLLKVESFIQSLEPNSKEVGNDAGPLQSPQSSSGNWIIDDLRRRAKEALRMPIIEGRELITQEEKDMAQELYELLLPRYEPGGDLSEVYEGGFDPEALAAIDASGQVVRMRQQAGVIAADSLASVTKTQENNANNAGQQE